MQMGMRPGAPGQMPLAASGMTMGARPMMPGQISATMPGLRPPVGSNVDMQGGPPAKKMKPEETLIPEQTFLRQNPPTGRLMIPLNFLRVPKSAQFHLTAFMVPTLEY